MLPLNKTPYRPTFTRALQGLAFVIVNFITMIYYEPLLACAPKPVHKVKRLYSLANPLVIDLKSAVSQALGGAWDPLFGSGSPIKEALNTVGESIRSLWHGATFDAANKFCPPSWIFYS